MTQPLSELITIAVISLLIDIPFLVTLQTALKRCGPESRTLAPGWVWLALIPIFGYVWLFIVVVKISRSLKNEFATVGIACSDANPGLLLGLWMCIGSFLAMIPGEPLRGVAEIGALLLWIAYWVEIAGYSRTLDRHWRELASLAS